MKIPYLSKKETKYFIISMTCGISYFLIAIPLNSLPLGIILLITQCISMIKMLKAKGIPAKGEK